MNKRICSRCSATFNVEHFKAKKIKAVRRAKPTKLPTLQEIRVEMKYSFAEMAECLGFKKSTYQGYETGRRKPPESVVRDALYYRDLGKKFMAGLPARVDEHIANKYPYGFMSAPIGEDEWD